jgi:hypothetical protein
MLTGRASDGTRLTFSTLISCKRQGIYFYAIEPDSKSARRLQFQNVETFSFRVPKIRELERAQDQISDEIESSECFLPRGLARVKSFRIKVGIKSE